MKMFITTDSFLYEQTILYIIQRIKFRSLCCQKVPMVRDGDGGDNGNCGANIAEN